MQIDLTGKNVLITGGTRGIGRVISLTLAHSGARIGAIYRSDAETAARTLDELNKLNNVNSVPNTPAHFTLQVDIADEKQATDVVQTAVERFEGAIDIVVLDAAAGSGGPLVGLSTEAWKRPFDVNVHGAFYIVRAAAPHLRVPASLIFISSGAGHEPLEGLSAYGASKAAVHLMAGVLAQELGPQGVRVNIVSPGSTHKEDSDPNADPAAYTESQRNLVNGTALRRLGTAQDVANVALFFASDLSGFVTGQWLRVNGGRV
jgi:3-oxoacyl-[acyl-carrier protein] reductase